MRFETIYDQRREQYYDSLDVITDIIPCTALYEQMAEECVELAQALLKKARKLRNENYTPKTDDEIDNDIIEEFTDVILCSDVLNIEADTDILWAKLNRWIDRTIDRTNHE